MSNPPGRGSDSSLFDPEDEEEGTLVDNTFWQQPKIPPYPALARFGRFEILGRIARGGMAEIYLARDRQSDGSVRHVVVKRVLPEMEDNKDLLAMFLEEGKTATRLYHQNVCHAYEVGAIEGRAFMALEWVFGPSLHEIISRTAARGQPLPWPVAGEIVANVADALAYVHRAQAADGEPLNIVHRDVSPHNVMITWGGAVKLLDFGIAKTSGDGAGATFGKYGYLSPEQAQGRPIDARSDLFALGIVLHEALTGQPLFDRPTVLETLSAIVREPVPPVRASRPEVPEAMDRILQKALAKDPEHRIASAQEMHEALRLVMRANGQSVTDQRVAMSLAGLFSLLDKEPLHPEQRQVTGAFSSLTADGAAEVLAPEEVVTYETFQHAPRPPAPEPIAPPAPIARAPKRSRVRTILVGMLLVAVAAMLGGTAALWLMGQRIPFLGAF